jgi:hypothetical protein
MKKIRKMREEFAMSVGSGVVRGLEPDTPPVSKSTVLRRKKFAGKEVFVVNSNSFHKAKLGKKKFEHYSSYVGKDEIGEQIREYARNNPEEPIILEDEITGAMVYLRYGKR